MRERSYGEEQPYRWIVYGMAVLLVGALAGYVLALQGERAGGVAAVAPAPASAPAAPIVDETALRAYRDILARDPRNAQAAINAGNLLYDGQRYVEAIPFYQQAFALRPSDVNVSTDLGTALWYCGRADEALAQYDRSLAIDANHPQTLFNVGVVKADGKQDDAGAIAAWERLLAAHPEAPNASTARQRITEARGRLTARRIS